MNSSAWPTARIRRREIASELIGQVGAQARRGWRVRDSGRCGSGGLRRCRARRRARRRSRGWCDPVRPAARPGVRSASEPRDRWRLAAGPPAGDDSSSWPAVRARSAVVMRQVQRGPQRLACLSPLAASASATRPRRRLSCDRNACARIVSESDPVRPASPPQRRERRLRRGHRVRRPARHGRPGRRRLHVLKTLDDGAWLIVEPFANDRLEDNLTPVGRVFCSASTTICLPMSRSQGVDAALGAQAGEARIREVVTAGGFASVG
jgi:hypothetical protein